MGKCPHSNYKCVELNEQKEEERKKAAKEEEERKKAAKEEEERRKEARRWMQEKNKLAKPGVQRKTVAGCSGISANSDVHEEARPVSERLAFRCCNGDNKINHKKWCTELRGSFITLLR